LCNDRGSIGRPHIAKVLVNKGLVSTPKEAFQKYLIKGRPAYVDRYKIHYKDVLKLIKQCNGVSSLAHPGEIYKGLPIDNIIKDLKVYGLNAIEVFHPCHTSRQVSDFYNISKKYSIGITGGSDCHGIVCGTDFLIGSSGLDENLTNKFLKLKYKR
jgi:predicted metal-dependent phosphoesterase TrpH